MTCSCFQTASPLSRGTLDPAKRVNYTLGLVLGEDEFRQEQLHFLERDKLHNRLLHGYGVACGLRVSTAPDGSDTEVRVEPGLAVTPRGNVVRVPEAQCAQLGAWLLRHRDEVLGRLGSPPAPGPLPLYVRLCFRDCETDPVPIPGGPCRSQEDSLAPSRITESFELELSLDPPDQAEEDMVRRFGELLGRIDIDDSGPSDVTEEEMEDLVRGLLEEASPPAGPDSPPGSNVIHLHPDDARRILRAAYRVWVAEVRPAIPGAGCAAEPAEDCVLLARLDLDVDEDLALTGDPQVSDDRRPVLLHTRLLQEMLPGSLDIEGGAGVTLHSALQGLAADDHPQYLLADGTRPLTGNLSAGNNRITNLAQAQSAGQAMPFGQTAGGDLGATYPNPTVTRLQGRFVSTVQPNANEVLTFSEGQWMPRPATAGVTAHSALTGLAADDHPQYLLANGTRALTGNLSANNNLVTNLAQATANGQAVRFEQAIKVSQAAAGDLGATYPNPTVVRLQGQPVATQAPNANEVLTFFNNQWTPRPAQGGGGVTAHSALTGLAADDHTQYLLASGARPLGGNLNANNNIVTNLAAATANGQAVRFEQAIKTAQAAAGDLGATYPNPTVVGLRGRVISTAVPNANEVLTFFGGQWTPRPVFSQPPPEVQIIESDLSRIDALSWRHGSSGALTLILDDQTVTGIAVQFTVPVQVRTGSLDLDTFQVFSEGQGVLRNQIRIVANEVVPIDNIDIQGGLIVRARRVPGPLARGAALLFNRSVFSSDVLAQPVRLNVVLRGDFILDEGDRAVDIEFLRGELPTGSHPTGSPFGLQGGRFESWFDFLRGGTLIRGGVDLNTATREELLEVPNIGPTLADRIIARREETGGFSSVDDLQEVNGITPAVLNRLRPPAES